MRQHHSDLPERSNAVRVRVYPGDRTDGHHTVIEGFEVVDDLRGTESIVDPVGRTIISWTPQLGWWSNGDGGVTHHGEVTVGYID